MPLHSTKLTDCHWNIHVLTLKWTTLKEVSASGSSEHQMIVTASPRFHYTIALTCIYGKESEWVWYASGHTFRVWTWYSIGNQCFDDYAKLVKYLNGNDWLSNHHWLQSEQDTAHVLLKLTQRHLRVQKCPLLIPIRWHIDIGTSPTPQIISYCQLTYKQYSCGSIYQNAP